jgi:geranylgeranyl reductase family protein
VRGAEDVDVAVVGAGPAGASAARAAVEAGASVVLLDRAALPRYKTCGGGLIGPTLAHLPTAPPTRAEVRHASFTLRGGRRLERSDEEALIATAARAELDEWLACAAVASGADLRTPCGVLRVAEEPDAVLLTTDAGPLRARVVVGADGTSGRISRLVGVRLSRIDLGLEVELEAGALAGEWADRIHLDWGPLPGSYGWVFPKGDSLTVGVIAAKGRPAETRAYLAALLREQRLDRLRVLHDSGHLTRCRAAGSPLGSGRLLLAGRAAAAHLDGAGLQRAYADAVGGSLVPEMAAGERCLRAFERRPGIFHRLIGGTDLGWRQFGRLVRGETTLDRALRRRVVRGAVGALSGSW